MSDIQPNRIDTGLLILRIGLGGMFLFHGLPKIWGGPERWAKIGAAIGNFGIHSYPEFWGFMAGMAEFGGGLCLIAGFAFRPALVLMMITMTVAASSHFARGQGLGGASHAVENGIVFFSLILVGPGKHSLDWWIKSRRKSAPANIT
ncbi:MAG: hypothetical protein A2W25_10390 [candidate division Zixibacteria bacterium RBG_16_53_22]|nr:MAG: hypothetical protein A2W25_10390 [candidate division Zixibacteria bacterium RBG_16_53_22]